jgi:uncharacterized protein YjcR
MSTTNENLIKPYGMKELADIYGVSTITLRTWILRHQDAIGDRMGKYYTTLQVKIIFERLGEPPVAE